jgi:hypothetical protein
MTHQHRQAARRAGLSYFVMLMGFFAAIYESRNGFQPPAKEIGQ